MRIGDVAAATGLETQAIRFYERKGLLPMPARSPNGYRVYDTATVARLEFIRSSQGAGLTLAEIATILDLRDDGDTTCAHVRDLLTAKRDDVKTRQRQLHALEAELDTLIRRSELLDPADCTNTQICHIITADTQTRTAAHP
jgi:MerR family mercuric resistance operon transcriptional regulator